MRDSRLWIAFFATLTACAAPTHTTANRAARAPVEPSLSRIFGARPIDGARPTELAISGDGRFVSYRYAAPAATATETAPAEAVKARLFIVETRTGETTDLGESPPAIWLAEGARLLWCSGNDVKVLTAGMPIDKAETLTSFDKPVSTPRVASNRRYLLVSSEDRVWVVDLNEPASHRKLDFDEGYSLERWVPGDGEPVALLRKRSEQPSSGPSSRPSSLPASAPESQSESAPASMPELSKYRVRKWSLASQASTSWEFEIPRARTLDNISVGANGDWALLTLREDERARRTGMLPDYLTLRVTTRPARGTNASESEPRRSLWIARRGMDGLLSLTSFSDLRRARFETVTPADGRPSFLTAVTEEDRKGRAIYTLDVVEDSLSTVNVEKLLEIGGPVGGVESMALENGKPLILSEGSGRARAYSLDRETRLKPFSPEGIDVHWLRFADANENRELARREGVALVCDPVKPFERQFWRIFRNGEPHAPLPMQQMFASSPVLSRNGSMVAFLGSTPGSVEDVYAMPTDGSAAPRKLTSTAPNPRSYPGGEVPMKFVNYPGLDGTPVWAMLYEPPPGVARNGAAVVFLHGAGYLQQVRASTGNPNYAVNHHFHRRLANLGYVVLAPDFRGSAGYGRKFRTDVFQKLGIPDSDDILASKRWLVANCAIDTNRVGLYGGSYGGFLTLMCLFRYPLEFGAGVALRSVTDWRSYQPDYTRPLLGGGPAEVPEVYQLCSPIDHADQLARPLLLLHGLMDDNVFAQDSLRLVEVLQKAGKTDLFELMLYPSQNHAFTSPHSWLDEYRRIESFFDKHLLAKNHE